MTMNNERVMVAELGTMIYGGSARLATLHELEIESGGGIGAHRIVEELEKIGIDLWVAVGGRAAKWSGVAANVERELFVAQDRVIIESDNWLLAQAVVNVHPLALIAEVSSVLGREVAKRGEKVVWMGGGNAGQFMGTGGKGWNALVKLQQKNMLFEEVV